MGEARAGDCGIGGSDVLFHVARGAVGDSDVLCGDVLWVDDL